MLNSYKNENKNNDKNQLRILDYRNGKYQGTTLGLNMTRDGIGMVLDHNYLLTIASWKGGSAEGQVIIIFPDSTLFYGFLKNKFPFGMGCYQVSGKLQIYSFVGSGSEDLFVLDDNRNSNLILLAISRSVMQKIYQQPTAYEHLLSEQDGQIKEKTKINLKSQVNYSGQAEKWDIIEKFFKTVYKSEMKSYKNFVKHYFNSQVKTVSAKIEVTQSKQQVQFSFINSSVLCKITQYSQNQADFKIKLMGYYNHNQRQFQVCKKTYKNDLIEETINDFKIQYPFVKRPISCIKQIHQYYKKSLHFVNNFLEIDYLYRVKFIYHSIETSIGETFFNTNAQRLLENTNELKQFKEDKKKSLSKQHSNDPYTIENLNKVKEDIYNAIKNKSSSKTKTKSISNSHINIYSQAPSISRASNIQKFTNKSSPLRQQVDYKSKINDRRILQSQLNTSPAKRSYVYLEDDENNRIRKSKNSPAKYNYVGDALNIGRNQSKSNGKLSKYKYLQKDQKKQAAKIQNLAALTTYYQEIENQLRKQVTPRKSQRKIKNTDGVADKRYTFTYNMKEGQRQERHQVKTPEKIENYQPIGTKKVYKYG